MEKNPENSLGRMTHGGFTLLEVLFALTILSVSLLGLASLTASVIRSNAFSGDFSTASTLAQDKLEALANLPFADPDLDDGILANNNWDGIDPWMQSTSAGNFDTGHQQNIDSNGTVSAGGKYTRTWNIWKVSNTRKDIAVIVSWKDHKGKSKNITLSTIRSDT